MSKSPGSLRPQDLWLVIATYALGTVLYYMLGVQFDASTYPRYMQFIDRDLLSNRLLESIWYYHAFPPMLNVFVGIGEKLFSPNAHVFFSASFHCLGLLLALSVWGLTSRLTLSRGFALATTAILIFSPAFALYENWLMYTFPAAALLAMATFALSRFVDTGRSCWGFTFFMLLASLALTRSIFHLAWLLLIVFVLLILMRQQRRQIAALAFLPVIIVAGWYLKNHFLFGSFASTSMAGLGLSNITTLTVPGDELLPLVKEGTLSPYALVSRYKDKEILFSDQGYRITGVPVLDRPRKTTGEYNFNYRRIVELNRIYLHDGFIVFREFPYYYVTGLRLSNLLFFSPTHMNAYFAKENRDAAWPMERVFNPLLYGVQPGFGYIAQPHWGLDKKRPHELEANPSLLLMVLWVLVIPTAYVTARASMLRKGAGDFSRGIVLAFIIGNTVYVYLLGTMLELGENYRYRFLIEPLFFVLTAVMLHALAGRIAAIFRRG